MFGENNSTSGTRQPCACACAYSGREKLFCGLDIFSSAMETLYSVPFVVLECPNIKLKKPSWLHMPSAMTVYAIVIVSYFLITGGKC